MQINPEAVELAGRIKRLDKERLYDKQEVQIMFMQIYDDMKKLSEEIKEIREQVKRLWNYK